MSSPDDLAACVGTKEFVASLAGYLHLRTPERDTVLYPADQLSDLRHGRHAGRDCAPCRCPW